MAPLHPQPREAEWKAQGQELWGLTSSAVQWGSPPQRPRLRAPPSPYLCSKDSVPRNVTINIFLSAKSKC